jgi:RNA polymerase sigma factor (sigma-70 family)
LLGRFAREDDQAAFAVLVERHTAMVFGVCRRSLPTVQDAEDACQATFLVLANRAKGGRWQESVANWLYATARKVSHNARVAAERRARRETGAVVPEAVEPVDRMTGRERLAALDAALDRLPARYREPLVLCYLEGLTRDEAAARLGVPRATVHTRIDRARKRLHDVLTRSGCALGAGLLALAASSPAGACPPRLVASVLAAASGSVPRAVGELVKEVAVNGVFHKTALVLAASALALAVGVGLAAVGPTRASEAPSPVRADRPPPAPRAAEPAPPVEVKASKQIEVKGVVVGPDDKPVAGAKLFLHSGDKVVPAPQPAAAADGTFAFSVNENGCGAVLTTAPGHGIALRSLDARPLPAVTLRLTPDEPIRGKVIDLEGKPVAGVNVSVFTVVQPREDKTLDRWLKAGGKPESGERFDFDWRHDWGNDFAGLLAPVTSARDGTFEVRGVGRDRIAILRVSGPTTVTQHVNVVTRKVKRFDGSDNISSSLTLTSFHGSDPVVVVPPVPATSGRVTDATTGVPVPGTVVYVENLVQPHTFLTGRLLTSVKAVADKDGRYTLPGLPRGVPRLSVIVFPPNGAPYHRLSIPVPDGAAERAAFDVKLTRGIPATVKIVDKATKKPVAGYLRYGVFPDANPNVKAVPNVWHHSAWTDEPYFAVPASEYRIVVFPGKGLLAAEAGGNGNYLSGVGAGAFEKFRTDDQLLGLASASNMYWRAWNTFAEIDVPADAKEFTCTLELDPGLAVPGRLVDADGKPVVGAESYGLENAMGGSGGWTRPAADAAFTVLALRPGEKRRVMFVHADRKLAGTAVVVGGAKEPAEVRMEPWGEITGRLVGADGKPVGGQLDLSWDVVHQDELKLGSAPAYHPGRGGVPVGADGRFRFTGLVPGLTYRWTASGPKGASATVPDAVPKSGKTTDLGEIVLSDES